MFVLGFLLQHEHWTAHYEYVVLSLYLTSGVSVSKKHCASLWKSSKFMTLCGKLSGIWWQGLQKWYWGIQWLPIGYSSTFPKFGTCTIDTRKKHGKTRPPFMINVNLRYHLQWWCSWQIVQNRECDSKYPFLSSWFLREYLEIYGICPKLGLSVCSCWNREGRWICILTEAAPGDAYFKSECVSNNDIFIANEHDFSCLLFCA